MEYGSQRRSSSRIRTSVSIPKSPRGNMSQSSLQAHLMPELHLGTLMKYDKRNNQKGRTETILSEKSRYSTQEDIEKYLIENSILTLERQSAMKIQRFWRKHLSTAKLRLFLLFAKRVTHNQQRLVLYLWRMHFWPGAPASKKMYDTVKLFYQRNDFLKKDKDEMFYSDRVFHVNTYEEYMKTNMFLIDKRIEVDKIRKFVYVIDRKLLRIALRSWYDQSNETRVLYRLPISTSLLVKGREHFAHEQWTFLFWYRYIKYKRTRTFNPIYEKKFCLEWALYKGFCLTKIRLTKNAISEHNEHIKLLASDALRNNFIRKKGLVRAHDNCLKIFRKNLMSQALMGLTINLNFKKINDGISKRTIRAWYNAIDADMLKSLKLSMARQRSDIKCLNTYIAKWKRNIVKEMTVKGFSVEQIVNNRIPILQTAFILLDDFTHYVFVTCFSRWKGILSKKRKGKRFVNWSLNYAKEQSYLKYFLDVFRDNADLPYSSLNYQPFKYEPNFVSHQKKQQKLNSKLARKRRASSVKDIPIYAPLANLSVTIYAAKHIQEYPMVTGNWAETATRDEVRNLFFRLVLAFVHRAAVNKFQKRDVRGLIKSFVSKNNIFNYDSIKKILVKQNEVSNVLRREMALREIRDVDLIASLAVHDAAKAFSETKNFSIEPTAIKRIDINVKLDLSPNSLTQRIERKKKLEKVSHPLLKPILKISDTMIANNRKYRRKPEDIFNPTHAPKRATSQAIPERKRKKEGESARSFEYDPYIPISQNIEIAHAMTSRDFRIQELRILHDNANKELIRIQRVEDLNVIHEAPKKSRVKRQTLMISGNRSSDALKLQQSNSNLKAKPKEAFNSSLLTKMSLFGAEIDPKEGISFNTLSGQFLSSKTYFNLPPFQRFGLISKRFLKIFNYVLSGSVSLVPNVEMHNLHLRVAKLIYRVMNARKKKKKPPFVLPEFVAPKNQLDLAYLIFLYDISDIPIFGQDILFQNMDAFLNFMDDPPSISKCFQNNIHWIKAGAALDKIAMFIKTHPPAADEEIQKNESILEEKKPLKKSSGTIQINRSEKTDNRQKIVQRKNSKKIEKKFMIEIDLIASILYLASFFNPLIDNLYPDKSTVNTFDEFAELKEIVCEKIKEPPTIVAESVDEPEDKKKTKTKGKKGKGNKKVGKKGKTIEKAPEQPEPVKEAPQRVSFLAPQLQAGSNLAPVASSPLSSAPFQFQTQSRPVSHLNIEHWDDEIELLLAISPYLIPCPLFRKMILMENSRIKKPE